MQKSFNGYIWNANFTIFSCLLGSNNSHKKSKVLHGNEVKATSLPSRCPQQLLLLYSWRFSHYSAPIHWLVHGHMTSNNETVSRQMPWAGNIAKTMTSNGKQFTVTREMLTAVARDQSVQLKLAWCCPRNLSAFFKICFCFVLFCYMTNHLMSGPLGNSEFCFPRISMFPERKLRKTLRFSGTKYTVPLGTNN